MNLIANNTTLSVWLQEWLPLYKLPAVKESTRREYRSHIRYLTNTAAAQKVVTAVTRADCQGVLNDLAEKGYKKSTIRKYRQMLHKAFEVLIEEGVLDRDPTEKLFIPMASTKKVRALTHKEQEAIEAACANDRLGHLVMFLLYSGLRKGELRGLEWTDYDPIEGSIMIRKSKTPAGVRKVYLVKTTKAIIDAMPRINKYIFNHTKNGPISDTVLKRLVERLRSATGIAEFTCHVCRHTFATRLCEKKVPAKAIACIIGHAKSDYVLDIYTDMEQEELRKAVYVLEEGEGYHSALMGATVNLPIDLYAKLEKMASEQHVSVDALVTFMLSSMWTEKIA